ncbi:MAG TPA: hypothetical protein VGO03_14640 [Acidimicrobiia bacterium]
MVDVASARPATFPPPPPPSPLPAPTPGKAARVSAVLVAALTLALFLNTIVQLVLDLDERRLQQRIAADTATDPTAVPRMIGHLRGASRVALVLVIVWFVVSVAWTRLRRGRSTIPGWPGARVRGPSLRQLEPALWWAVMALVVASFATNVHVNALVHSSTGPSDVATYRGWNAFADGVRAAMWAGWFVIVLLVTWSGRVAATQQRNDLAGGFGDVGARAEHGRHTRTA